MATHTPNYDLKKPAPDDFYNVADQNENMDKIDSALKGVSNDLTSQQADYMYQVPNIVGTQIRINKLSNTNRLFFRLDDDLSGDITISTDGGATSKPLQDIDGNQITQLDKGFVEVVADANFFILRNRGLGGADKQALIDIVNEAERNESDVKSNLITVVNDKVGSTLPPNAPWIDIQNVISGMTNKRWATGVSVSSINNSLGFLYSNGSVNTGVSAIEVSGLDFKPSMIATVRITSEGNSSGVGVLFPENISDNGGLSKGRIALVNLINPQTYNSAVSVTYQLDGEAAYVNDNGFRIPVAGVGEFKWFAYE